MAAGAKVNSSALEGAIKQKYDDVYFETVLKAAELGDPKACFQVSVAYLIGQGMDADEAKSFEFCRRAVDGGYKAAFYSLARHFFYGIGTEKRVKEATYYSQIGYNETRSFDCGLLLAKCYQEMKQPEAGFELYLEMAENGSRDAQFITSHCYLEGNGVTPNHFFYLKWIRKAASSGHLEAQVELGKRLFRGDGIPMDRELGLELITNASKRKYIPAVRALEEITKGTKSFWSELLSNFR